MSKTVYVSRKTLVDKIYHENKGCSHISDNHRPIEYNKIEGHYSPCGHCTKAIDQTDTQTQTCSFCGKTVGKLPDHLPCEGVE